MKNLFYIICILYNTLFNPPQLVKEVMYYGHRTGKKTLKELENASETLEMESAEEVRPVFHLRFGLILMA